MIKRIIKSQQKAVYAVPEERIRVVYFYIWQLQRRGCQQREGNHGRW